MTMLRRQDAIRLLFLGLFLVLPVAAWAENPPIVAKMAKLYGVDSFEQIAAIRFTFNAQLGALRLSRIWIWQPKTGEISFEGKDKDGKPVKVSYVESHLNSAPDDVKNVIDPAFLNDQYNLLFPLHAYWDGAAAEDDGMQKLPLGKGSAELVTVKYSAGGYTPGDTWDLYVRSDGRVVAFTYHRGGPKKPSLVTATWAGYKRAGPLLIATDRRGTADGTPVRIFFTNVAVKLVGSNAWLNAE